MDWEIGVFFHFGIRTFYEGHTDWDGKEMPAARFNPDGLDCEQWIRAAKAGGAQYAILTTKHHDGFANWPSAYTEYSVKNTPWKDGNGDVVREFTDACRTCGIRTGLYYSPAQKDFEAVSDKEYDDYFISQISELLSNYGKIDYLWFDGCGSADHVYDREKIIKVIRTLQPEITVFSMWDPDTRWVGNEEGIAPCGTGYVIGTPEDSVKWQETQWSDSPQFLPFECDCRIRRKNWFYSENDLHLLRSADELVGLYDYSVGRGGNLLVNMAPDRNGRIPEEDCAVFADFGRKIRERFENPIAAKWEADGSTIQIRLESPQLINTIVLYEDLTKGQRIEAFRISCKEMDTVVFRGDRIGHKCIISLPPVHGDTFYIRLEGRAEDYFMKKIELFYH